MGGAVSPARRALRLPGERTGALGWASFVTMVQSADLRQLHHRTQFRRLNGALIRSVFWPARDECVNARKYDFKVRRKEASLNTMTWSRHSRRIDPISRST